MNFNRAMHPTTQLGVPIVPFPDAAARLAIAGLHDRDPRYPFALAAVQAASPERRLSITARFAPAPLPDVPIPAIPADASYTAALAASADRPAIESAAAGLAAVDHWSLRAELIRDFVRSYVTQELSPAAIDTVRGTITVFLERIAAPAVNCLELAVFMTMCGHAAWRDAGVTWLRPVHGTWLGPWLLARPDLLIIIRCSMVLETARAEAAAA